MKLDFEQIIKEFSSKANAIYMDRDKLKDLFNRTKKKIEGNKEFRSLFDDIRVMIELVKDYRKGEYKELSRNSIILVLISLVYLVSPIDIIPDFLIGGFVDDAAVIAYVLKKITVELAAYKEWRKSKVSYNDNMIEITLDTNDDE